MINMLKNTGIIRKLDDLGRIVIPMEIRKKFNISEGDGMEIHIDSDNTIVLKKYERNCVFCGNNKNLKTFNDKLICKKCLNSIDSFYQ